MRMLDGCLFALFFLFLSWWLLSFWCPEALAISKVIDGAAIAAEVVVAAAVAEGVVVAGGAGDKVTSEGVLMDVQKWIYLHILMKLEHGLAGSLY